MIDIYNSTSRYLENLLSIDNIYFEQKVQRIYPVEVQLKQISLIYIMQKKFSNFSCLASYFAHLGTLLKTYIWNDENMLLGK